MMCNAIFSFYFLSTFLEAYSLLEKEKSRKLHKATEHGTATFVPYFSIYF